MKELKGLSKEELGENSEVSQILKNIGFVSAASKEEAGRDWVKMLANDLFTICNNTLFKQYGGIVSLLDLFYFYNMKRNTQLVSPEELLEACEQFGNLGYQAKLISYPNNIKMIESTLFDEKQDF
jgi:ESCRT-II complex subunit VPS36